MTVYSGHPFDAAAAGSGWAPQPALQVAATLDPATGFMTATARPGGGGVAWRVNRVTVRAATTHLAAAGPAFLRVDQQPIEHTARGGFDTDTCNPPIYVLPGSSIDVVWPALVAADDVAFARFEYDQISGLV